MTALSSLARGVFLKGLGLKQNPGNDAATLQGELVRTVNAFSDAARKDGHSGAVVEEARYALCAWLDETVFSTTPFSIQWLGHSLTVREFQDQVAGNNFFAHMERLHQKADHKEALSVYAECILLGFKGRFRIEDPAQLRILLDQALQKTVEPAGKDGKWFPAILTDPGKRPKERTGRMLVWIAIGVASISVILYILLAFLAQQGA